MSSENPFIDEIDIREIISLNDYYSKLISIGRLRSRVLSDL
ncbi:MAG: hypothetical protein ACXAAM_04125 [Candidatus Heimdallarchaeaceae archaeon]